ncbi:MAG: hypothetical protein HZC22_06460 [Rhodocyclales bacterium]|nr:hypothetical protein [Rhodocyclales bacterium]
MSSEFQFGWFSSLARRLLYTWVRAQALLPAAEAPIDPDRPVCYVIQDRRLSNVLVLQEETRRAGLPPADGGLAVGRFATENAFFCLTRPQPLLAETARERYRPHPCSTGSPPHCASRPGKTFSSCRSPSSGAARPSSRTRS